MASHIYLLLSVRRGYGEFHLICGNSQIFFISTKGDNWWQTTIIYPFQPEEVMVNFILSVITIKQTHQLGTLNPCSHTFFCLIIVNIMVTVPPLYFFPRYTWMTFYVVILCVLHTTFYYTSIFCINNELNSFSFETPTYLFCIMNVSNHIASIII